MHRLIKTSPLFLAFALMTGCHTTPTTEGGRQTLEQDAQAALTRMTTRDPSLRPFLDRAYGYVIFPSIGKGGAIVGGAYGRGVVYQGGRAEGYADVTQASIGLQLGGQSYTQLIAFQDLATFNQFKANTLTFSANASAVAIKAGAGAATQFQNGTAVFTDSETGLMGEASIGGQQLRYQPR